MSLRYTGEATMDEPALRDVERWKDKIEVRLDNRQVFFLFFGSAMVACMLFVLGVIVGKRLESRGRADAPAIEDPLAILDRFGVAAPAPAPAALTFPRALAGVGASKPLPATLVPERTERAERAERTERASGKQILTAGAAVSLGLGKAASPAPVTSRPLSAAPTSIKPAAAMAASGPTTPVTPALAPAATASKKLAALPRPLPVSGVLTGGGPGKTVTAPAVDKPKGHYLLQLSSFQERGEADNFARRFSSQNAYVVATEIPGKGTWYRVRVGNYGNLQEATTAKTAFEREHNVIAYVAGGGPAK